MKRYDDFKHGNIVAGPALSNGRKVGSFFFFSGLFLGVTCNISSTNVSWIGFLLHHVLR